MTLTTWFNFKKRKASFNKKLYVFLFCLTLSFFFWLLNALSKNSTTEVLFSVKYINSPKDKVVLNELPNKLAIRIKGLGFDLLGYKLSLGKSKVQVDLSRLNTFNDDVKKKAIATNTFSNVIENQLGQHLEIKEIFPDSIRFLLDKRVSKKVEIIPSTTLKFKRPFKLYGEIIVKPAVTTVSGPASIIDTLTKIYTEDLVLNNLEKTTTEGLGFNPIYTAKKIQCVPNRVLLHIPVEQFTETSVMVKVNSINVPDSLEIKPIPNEIEVKFLIPLGKMVRIPNAQFTAEIDYNQINDSFNHKLKVELTKYPDYIQSLNLNPRKVEYILKKRK